MPEKSGLNAVSFAGHKDTKNVPENLAHNQ
jgi:hypothetical protein